MIAQRATAILLFLCGIGLAAFSASQASGELAPYLMGGVRPEQRYSSILSGQVTPAASRWSRDLFALDCLDVPRTVYGRLQPKEGRESFARTCYQWSSQLTGEAPTYSLGWLARASSAAILQQWPEFQASLAQSRRGAPHVEWLAIRRTALADRYQPLDARRADAGYRADLAVLLHGDAGLRELARRFVTLPELRSTITEVAETVPARQTKLLAAVRRESGMEAR